MLDMQGRREMSWGRERERGNGEEATIDINYTEKFDKGKVNEILW